MNLAKGPARFALAVALLALMVGPMLFSASSALAQVPSPPSNYYGYLDAGSTVTASIGEAECGSAEADADGLWFIVIDADNECNPVEGDEISFAIDGDAAEQTVAYTPGWAPADVATGMALTVAAMPAMPDPVVMTRPMDDGHGRRRHGSTPWTTIHDDDDDDDAWTMTVDDTGNGVTSSGQGSNRHRDSCISLLTAGVAGARTVTGRVS